ncbi:MAG: DUF99 family protein [Myxococcales bacterium]|nr:DUF99 family protein [Polyangiaceae bacterium]MDW8250881.1 DUF99 family protein [Myxococcales bacterium]
MRLPAPNRTLRVVGFDDAPFRKVVGARVPICGVICANTRFEGMVWGQVRRDGWGATNEICRLLIGGKFLPQVHLVLLDGLAFGGFNVVDLPRLAATLERPCVAVMRRLPNLAAVEAALQRLTRPAERMELFRKGGEIHQVGSFVFQAVGAGPAEIARALTRLSDRGNVPEALRLAHLIGSAVQRGQSGRRA